MPTVAIERALSANSEQIWDVLGDPEHLPRWWPRIERVENVTARAWTTVARSARGQPVRFDYELTHSERPRRRAWAQQLEGSPFERLLAESATEAEIRREGEATFVRLTVRQKLRGMNRLGGFMFRRATRRMLNEALDGLEQVCG